MYKQSTVYLSVFFVVVNFHAAEQIAPKGDNKRLQN